MNTRYTKTSKGSNEFFSYKGEKLYNNNSFLNSKKFIEDFCQSLSHEHIQDFSDIVNKINEYSTQKLKFERVLYSTMTQVIFSFNEENKGVFYSNFNGLLDYILNNHNSEDGLKRLATKLYDHAQLAAHQLNLSNEKLKKLEEALNEKYKQLEEKYGVISQELKSSQKDYISILGIFSTVVLAFSGGMTFSSSVLQTMNQVSIFRLILVIDILACVLLNAIYLLTSFIFRINEKKTIQFIKIIYWNVAFLLIAVVIVGIWFLNKYIKFY